MMMMDSVESLMLASKISDHPLEVKTHFLMLEIPNRRGQARYRCLTCNHEFECTGRARLIQHITGGIPAGAKVKHVKACPSPYLPLKENLLVREKTETSFIRHQKLDQLKRKLFAEKVSGVVNEKKENGNEPASASQLESGELLDGKEAELTIEDKVLSSSPSVDELRKPKGRKRVYEPSTSSNLYPSKKAAQPPTSYLISNDRLMSLIRRMYSLNPETVQQAIVLESMEDTKKNPQSRCDSTPANPPQQVPAWVSSLFTAFVASPLSSSGELSSSGYHSAKQSSNPYEVRLPSSLPKPSVSDSPANYHPEFPNRLADLTNNLLLQQLYQAQSDASQFGVGSLPLSEQQNQLQLFQLLVRSNLTSYISSHLEASPVSTPESVFGLMNSFHTDHSFH